MYAHHACEGKSSSQARQLTVRVTELPVGAWRVGGGVVVASAVVLGGRLLLQIIGQAILDRPDKACVKEADDGALQRLRRLHVVLEFRHGVFVRDVRPHAQDEGKDKESGGQECRPVVVLLVRGSSRGGSKR